MRWNFCFYILTDWHGCFSLFSLYANQSTGIKSCHLSFLMRKLNKCTSQNDSLLLLIQIILNQRGEIDQFSNSSLKIAICVYSILPGFHSNKLCYQFHWLMPNKNGSDMSSLFWWGKKNNSRNDAWDLARPNYNSGHIFTLAATKCLQPFEIISYSRHNICFWFIHEEGRDFCETCSICFNNLKTLSKLKWRGCKKLTVFSFDFIFHLTIIIITAHN